MKARNAPGRKAVAMEERNDRSPVGSARIAPLSEEIARRIKAHRQTLGMSQEAFARRLAVTRQTVSNWECARTIPDAVSIQHIARVCGVTVSELLGEDERRTRARALASRRELALVMGIVLGIQIMTMVANGIELNSLGSLSPHSFGAFRLGALALGALWMLHIARREGLTTIRQMIDFASLASRKPGGTCDKALRFVGRWFWTIWFAMVAATHSVGCVLGMMGGTAEATSLIGPAFLLLVGTIPFTWEYSMNRGRGRHSTVQGSSPAVIRSQNRR